MQASGKYKRRCRGGDQNRQLGAKKSACIGVRGYDLFNRGTWVTLNKRISDKDQENDNCREEVARLNKELKEWQTIVVPGLRQIAPQVAETTEKLDSIINNN